MAGNAIGISIRIVGCFMTFRAVYTIMALGKREKTMIKACPRPFK
jgi:hypothetical protein